MADKFVPSHTVWKRKKESAWPGIIGAVILFIIIIAVIG